MITDFLLDHSALVPVVFVLVAVVCVGVGGLVARVRRGRQRILWLLVALSVLPVVVLTLVPAAGRAGQSGCVVQFSVPTLTRVELLANVALFVPPVFFATVATRRPLPMLAAGAGLSAAIEAVQAVVPALGRACDTGDWTMNTLGTVLAVLLATATIALTDRAPGPAGGKTSGLRRR
ncbi:VanZ family protein [Amycolatopsis rifamycinica]|uniref:VanZ family protein n=1 Tax=Amycolatopsis rifamycinica TaxID=287986 RepID=A0A066TQ99_9PSEU|nr:VanZ family protein [Amycolatopsis rifamycinica]KDN17040.1 VanZ family protein [Amycolatopsis rifamycinica]